MLLEVAGLTSHYGRIAALQGVDLAVAEGELVALVGANGAGKTTLLRTISGVHGASAGTIRFRDRDVTRLDPSRRVALGISQVPEGRQVFGPMSVEDNLRLGAYTRRGDGIDADLDKAYGMFPALKARRAQAAGTLSGGEQQMLAMARALMARPRLLLLDEPSMGLAPFLVEQIFGAIADLKRAGTTIFLVEQNAQAALVIADRGYVIETGTIVLSDTGAALLANDRVKDAYLGVGP
jgi:branched-chain amino acid transport system ATP-binding protein